MASVRDGFGAQFGLEEPRSDVDVAGGGAVDGTAVGDRPGVDRSKGPDGGVCETGTVEPAGDQPALRAMSRAGG
jgi:hypothetical protein